MSQKAVFTDAANNRQFILSRGKDIPGEVLRGEVDVGFCGDDVYRELQTRGLCKSLGFIAVGSMGCQLVVGALENQDLSEPLRVATSFPAFAREALLARGYVLADIQEFGGKVEGKLASGAYNVIVDIRQTGKTLEDNSIVVKDVLLEDMKTGIVFRKEPVVSEENSFEPWKLLTALRTMLNRKQMLDAGIEPDTSKKNTMLLLSDENRLAKAIGEESAELVRALVRSEDVVDEAADMVFTTLLAPIRDGSSGLAVLYELARRNQTSKK